MLSTTDLPANKHMCVWGNKTTKKSVFVRGKEEGVQEHDKRLRFEQLILPHLDAAYNLARWLTRNDQDAQDVAQEACLRALILLIT